jgi:hypothetical protein
MSAVALAASGDLALPARYLSGIDLVVQRMRIRLATVFGTWPDDAAFGLPHDRWIDRPGQTTPAIVASTMRAQLEADPDVQSVVSVEGTSSGQVVNVVARVIVRADGESATVTVNYSPLLRTGAPALFTVTGRTSPGPLVT